MAEYRRDIHWRNITATIFIPLCGVLATIWTPLNRKTLLLAAVFYVLSGFGITAGYHRLWSHCSYTASLPLRIFLAICGGAAVQGSIKAWSSEHRVHHRFTDTDKDPYSPSKGLWYSHMGWLFYYTDKRNYRGVDVRDLESDPVVVWQDKYYNEILLVAGFILPTAVAGLFWGDWKGGLVYASIVRMFLWQQATFCVNSLAHWLGEQTFDDGKSARDHIITAIITFGEGYHNFHHEFPQDYRNAIKWYQYDPTKWLIWACSQLGLAYDLKQFCHNEIKKGIFQQKLKALSATAADLDWGNALHNLPHITQTQCSELINTGRKLIIIADIIHDVESFISEHPGGEALILAHVGKDATAPFNGAMHKHSTAAHNKLSSYRIALLGGRAEDAQIGHDNSKFAIQTVQEQILSAVSPVTLSCPDLTPKRPISTSVTAMTWRFLRQAVAK